MTHYEAGKSFMRLCLISEVALHLTVVGSVLTVCTVPCCFMSSISPKSGLFQLKYGGCRPRSGPKLPNWSLIPRSIALNTLTTV